MARGNKQKDAVLVGKCISLSAQGKSVAAIAREVGVNRHTVDRILNKQENIENVEISRKRLIDKCLINAERFFSEAQRRKLAGTTVHSLISAGRECVYTSNMLLGNTTPDININLPTNINDLKAMILSVKSDGNGTTQVQAQTVDKDKAVDVEIKEEDSKELKEIIDTIKNDTTKNTNDTNNTNEEDKGNQI